MDEKKTPPSSMSDIDEDYDEDAEKCGIGVGCGGCRSRRFPIPCFECGNNAKCFLALLSITVLIQGMAVNGLVNIVISTIEKRFHLQSSETGFIAGCYDLGFLLAVPLVTYVGGRGHKPYWIGWGTFVMGLGSITFSLPHFIAPTYEVPDDSSFICSDNTPLGDCGKNYLAVYRGFFIVGHMLHGMGACGLFTLVITYIDANVKQSTTSLYHGIFFAFSVAGPGIGFILGGALIKLYTNLGEQVSIDESSAYWIGNWWLGYVVCGICFFVLSIPILLFPNELPGTSRFRKGREADIDQNAESLRAKGDENFGKSFRDIPRCLKVVLKNVTLVCISIAGAMDSGTVIALATFGPKYVETMFRIPPSEAGLYFGIAAIIAAFASHILGGIVVAKMKLTIKSMLKFAICCSFCALCCLLVFLIKCENPEIPGVTISFNGETSYNCDGSCGCSTVLYDPVCGADGYTYVSECDAGCTRTVDEKLVNCTRIFASSEIPSLGEAVAETGKCGFTTSCPSAGIVIAVSSVAVFFSFLKFQPVLQVSLRTVPFYQRSFAIGIQWVIMRCLGLIPLPLILGTLLDNACLIWEDVCGNCGSCKLYDNNALANSMTILFTVGKIISIVTLTIALCLYKPPPVSNSTLDTLHYTESDIASTENFNQNNCKELPKESYTNQAFLEL